MAADSLSFYFIHIVNTYHARYWMAVIIKRYIHQAIHSYEARSITYSIANVIQNGFLLSCFMKSWMELKERQMFATYLRWRICSVKICAIASCENNDVNFSPIWHGDFHIYPPFVSLLRFMANFCSNHIFRFFSYPGDK